MLLSLPELRRIKTAAAPEVSYDLAGRLFLSKSGWILLSAPNSLVYGLFNALDEEGLEIPKNDEDQLRAHISVIRPEELERIGGPDVISERGLPFHYTLGPLESVKPDGWAEMEKVWFVRVHSPELERLRKSYGLSARPNDDKYHFHLTVAVRRRGVLRSNEISKIRLDLTPREDGRWLKTW